MFQKFWVHMFDGFRAAITRKTHFLTKSGQKMPFFWPKTVFLGPERSDIGPHTLFSGCWTHKSVFSRVFRQMIKGVGSTITSNPHFFAQKCQFVLPKTAFLGHEWSVVG